MIIRFFILLVLLSFALYYALVIVQECTRFKIFGDNGVKNYIPFYGLFVESKKNKEEKNSKNNHSKTKKDEN